jgi:hypothetical protein
VANGYPRGKPENKESRIMANKGKTQLLMTWVASPDKVSEVDRLAESHGSFMALWLNHPVPLVNADPASADPNVSAAVALHATGRGSRAPGARARP